MVGQNKRVLFDTCLLLRVLLHSADELPKPLVKLLLDEDTEICFSVISVFEVSVKHHKHPDSLPISGRVFYEQCLEAGYVPLNVTAEDIAAYDFAFSKVKPYHHDPHDHLIMATAIAKDIPLFTMDSTIAKYESPRVHLIAD